LEIPYTGLLITFMTQLMPFVFLCIAFTASYKLIPYTQVHFTAALVGGITAGLLWQLAGAAFTAFVASSVYYTAVYSSFAILIVFFFWLYVGWFIVLVGGEVAYVYQYPYAYRTRASWQSRGYVFRAWLAFSALAEVTRRYLKEETPWRLTELSATLNVSAATLEELIDEFVRCGLLYRSSEPEGIVLGRPPEQVPVIEVFQLLDGSNSAGAESSAENSDPISHLLSHRYEALQQAFTSVTLRSLVAPQPIPNSNAKFSSPVSVSPSSSHDGSSQKE
jgi:membrane protein